MMTGRGERVTGFLEEFTAPINTPGSVHVIALADTTPSANPRYDCSRALGALRVFEFRKGMGPFVTEFDFTTIDISVWKGVV